MFSFVKVARLCVGHWKWYLYILYLIRLSLWQGHYNFDRKVLCFAAFSLLIDHETWRIDYLDIYIFFA